MRKKYFFMFILFFIISGYLFGADRAGRAVYIKGDVKYSINGTEWQILKLLQFIPEGSCVKVGDNSEAALILKDRSQIRLKAGSIFCVKKSGSAPGESTFKRGLLKLKKGALWFRNKRKTPKPLIETPVITASIRGTEMAINVPQGNKTNVVVLEGKVKCSTEQSQVIIKRGEEAKAIGNKIEIVKLIRPENKVQWLLITPDIVGPSDRNVTGNIKKAIEIAKDAMRLLANNESQKALLKVKDALKLSPERASVNVAMATILQSFGKFNEALKYSKKALQEDPKSIPALLRTIELYLGMNKIEKAENLISNFKGEKVDPRIYLMYGYLSLIKLKPKDAISYFNKSLQLKPDFSEAYLGLGLAEYYNGKVSDGLKHMEYACLLNPLAAYPHYYLGKAIYGIGERKNAIVELKRAIQLDSNDPTPYVYLATIFSDTYKPGDAILALQKAIELNNNKLATRSRFLLDADRATKNVSLSWALSMMGLNEWARAIGDEAVWFDPANSGAYLFRASEAVGQKAIDAATLGDVRRAMLLQPVNSNTYITYTDYQGLLERPAYQGSVTLLGGTDKTGKASGFFRGGKKNIAFYVDADVNHTDGPKKNTGQWGEISLGRAKYAINENNEILFEGIIGHNHQQDINVWVNGNEKARDFVDKNNYWSIYGGYHWRQTGNNHFLASIYYNGSDGNWDYKTTGILRKGYHRRNFRTEFLEILNLNKHKISIGGSFEYAYTFSDYEIISYLIKNINSQDYKREFKGYLRDLWHINKNFILDLGISACKQDGYWLDRNGDGKEKERILPHAGIIGKLSKITFRMGYYHELQPNYLSGTIQPVEVAGFKKITGVYPGTWTKFYGAGIDNQWNKKNFTRVEFLRYERREPFNFFPNPYLNLSWKDERDSIIRLVHNILITEQFALSFSGTIREVKTRKFVSRRTDRDLGVKFTWVHPSGFIAQTALWLVDQDTGKGYNSFEGDKFGIFSISLQKSFFNKKGLIYVNWENIFDEEYKYLLFEPIELEQLPWQNNRFSIGLRWNF